MKQKNRYAHLVYAREKAAVTNKLKQLHRREEIKKKAAKVVAGQDPLASIKIQLAILYKGEGSKHGSYSGLALGSSEPAILRLYIGLLLRAYGKSLDGFRARIQHRCDQDSAELTKYWAQELSFQDWQFYKPYADARSMNKPTKKPEYKGVCVISCSGADIQIELEAIVQLYAQNVWGYSSAD